ncbi:MAG: hypothetical protein AAFY41_18745, partial [Bacteroidota bacterium]
TFQQTNRFLLELVAIFLVLTHLMFSSTSSTLRGDFSAVHYSGGMSKFKTKTYRTNQISTQKRRIIGGKIRIFPRV